MIMANYFHEQDMNKNIKLIWHYVDSVAFKFTTSTRANERTPQKYIAFSFSS